MNQSDNITAFASAIGGAVTVIRLSGPQVLDIANRVWRGRTALSAANVRKMMLGRAAGDQVLAVYMKAPFSYTGDDVVELQCHGGAATANAVMKELLAAGCRMAEPGEFTCRAFLNGKLDLLQAEAVADIIASSGSAALHLAQKQLAGSLSNRINELYDQIITLRSECESRLDFPDEELDFDNSVPEKLQNAGKNIEKLLESATAGAIIRDGVPVVLAGKPNAGKSSLLNAILGFDRAIVSAIAGTTRDTVESDAVIRGIGVKLTDTAGLRESDDPVEKMGIERSWNMIRSGAVTFWLLDASADDLLAETAAIDRNAPGLIAVWNKCDIVPERQLPETGLPTVKISALTGENITGLFDAFEKTVFGGAAPVMPELALNARSAALLTASLEHLTRAAGFFTDGDYELSSLELAEASVKIGEITGRSAAPDILDKIFHKFCIGK
ncbi:MAG: tRNA uridine-5-carboxymethylaminomethyl(34) synthesis GTPase MnmE [Lentisphaerae bacterium]|nr:tRNA uridine-5-carboxymethylaminomethyl(34) synthesis GTPase MnmE [Lentisphaerota bacterium]